MIRIAVLCACYNRCDITLRSLEALKGILSSIDDVNYSIFITDDCSPDLTAKKIKDKLPDVLVQDGTGDLYWNRGMRRSYYHAKSYGTWDAYLLFNDDTDLLTEGVSLAIEVFRERNLDVPTAVVGSTLSLATGEVTYGGYSQSRRHFPFSIQRITLSNEEKSCDTFNGNFVIVPRSEMEAVDPFPWVYHHNYGDLDLGYRLRARGVSIVVASVPVGYVERNAAADLSSFRARWKAMLVSPQGLFQHLYFYRRTVDWPYWPVIMCLGGAVRLKRVLFG